MAYEKICKYCGKSFLAKEKRFKFCNSKCWKSYLKEKSINKCKRCGKEFKRYYVLQKYCSHLCYTESNKGENNKTFKTGISDYGGYLVYNKNKKYVHKVLFEENSSQIKCAICKVNDIEDVHHLDNNKKNNNLYNLIGLCKSCHGRIHGKKIKITLEIDI